MAAALPLLTQMGEKFNELAVFDIFISRWMCPVRSKGIVSRAVVDVQLSAGEATEFLTCPDRFRTSRTCEDRREPYVLSGFQKYFRKRL